MNQLLHQVLDWPQQFRNDEHLRFEHCEAILQYLDDYNYDDIYEKRKPEKMLAKTKRSFMTLCHGIVQVYPFAQSL